MGIRRRARNPPRKPTIAAEWSKRGGQGGRRGAAEPGNALAPSTLRARRRSRVRRRRTEKGECPTAGTMMIRSAGLVGVGTWIVAQGFEARSASSGGGARRGHEFERARAASTVEQSMTSCADTDRGGMRRGEGVRRARRRASDARRTNGAPRRTRPGRSDDDAPAADRPSSPRSTDSGPRAASAAPSPWRRHAHRAPRGVWAREGRTAVSIVSTMRSTFTRTRDFDQPARASIGPRK